MNRLEAGNSNLRSGWSTGTVAAALVEGALLHLVGQLSDTVEVDLPDARASIEVKLLEESSDFFLLGARKNHNDDLDVTKGILLTLHVARTEEAIRSFMNPAPHTPFTIHGEGVEIRIFAGRGVGVVERPGLRVEPGFPAINPYPRELMTQALKRCSSHLKNLTPPLSFNLAVGAREGERIALETTNPKVGIRGGVSILGSRGIVKPISSDAYLESLRAEISVASHAGVEKIHFVLGNSALKFIRSSGADEVSIIESGNFIYDSLKLLSGTPFRFLHFTAGPGKGVKVWQGYKNSHNRYGEIRMKELLEMWLVESPTSALRSGTIFNTVSEMEKSIRELDGEEAATTFLELIARGAAEQFRNWILQIRRDEKMADSLNMIQTTILGSEPHLGEYSREVSAV